MNQMSGSEPVRFVRPATGRDRERARDAFVMPSAPRRRMQFLWTLQGSFVYQVSGPGAPLRITES